MTVLGALARRETRAVQATAWGDWGEGGGGLTWAGPNVTTSSALQLLTVYGCNRFICEGISTLPVDVKRQLSDGTKVDAPKPPWVVEPAPDLPWIAWATQVLTSALLAGNAYCLKDYADGQLRNLTPLDPTKVSVRRERGRKIFDVAGTLLDTASILHIPGVMWPGSDVGLSPVEAARQSIGLGLGAEETAARLFGQGIQMGGVIEVPGHMQPEKTKEMARSWARAHSGKSKSHLPGVLEGGATWKDTAVAPEQAQFLQTRGYTAAEICSQMFLIDPSEFGLNASTGGPSSLTYANLEQRDTRKVQVTFLPWIVRIETALSALLPQPRYLKINVNGLLRGDQKTRFESYGIGIQNKFIVPNEARDFEDWEPLPGGDTVADIISPKI